MSSGGGKNKPMKKMAHVGPNMTPMVDVVMCILIFFMLGSTFLTPELFLSSNLPIDKHGLGQEDMSQSQKLPSVRIMIKIRRQGDDTWVAMGDSQLMKMNKVDDKDQSQNEAIADFFAQKNATLSPDVQIIIVPDKLAPYQDVISVYDYCMRARFKQVAFAPAA